MEKTDKLDIEIKVSLYQKTAPRNEKSSHRVEENLCDSISKTNHSIPDIKLINSNPI